MKSRFLDEQAVLSRQHSFLYYYSSIKKTSRGNKTDNSMEGANTSSYETLCHPVGFAEAHSRVLGTASEFLFDAKQLVVLGRTFSV